jgi:hypothetical protein
MGNCACHSTAIQSETEMYHDTMEQIQELRQVWNTRSPASPVSRAETQHMFNMMNSLSMAYFLKLYMSVHNQPLHGAGDLAFRQCVDRVTSSRLG